MKSFRKHLSEVASAKSRKLPKKFPGYWAGKDSAKASRSKMVGGESIKNAPTSQDYLKEFENFKEPNVTEGDVISTKFATKQAQKGKDRYQRQPDVEIPLYDRARNRSVLPKYAEVSGGQLEPFDHFETRVKSSSLTQIVGVTQDSRKLVTGTMMAPPESVEKFVAAMNRGGFSDVPIQRVSIKGYSDADTNPSVTEARLEKGVAEGSLTTKNVAPVKARPLSMERPKGEWDPIHGKAPKKGTLKYDMWKQRVAQDKKGVAEGKGLAKKVKIVKGPDAGKTGWIREVKHGAFKGAPKTYYIDLDDGGQANNLPATALRLVKEQGVAEGFWDDAVKATEKASKERAGKPFEKNPASHDKNGVYRGDKDMAGNPAPKRKERSIKESPAIAVDPAQIKQAQMLKTQGNKMATITGANPANLVKSLDAASKGMSTPASTASVAPTLDDFAKLLQDPVLGPQLNILLNRAKQLK